MPAVNGFPTSDGTPCTSFITKRFVPRSLPSVTADRVKATPPRPVDAIASRRGLRPTTEMLAGRGHDAAARESPRVALQGPALDPERLGHRCATDVDRERGLDDGARQHPAVEEHADVVAAGESPEIDACSTGAAKAFREQRAGQGREKELGHMRPTSGFGAPIVSRS